MDEIDLAEAVVVALELVAEAVAVFVCVAHFEYDA